MTIESRIRALENENAARKVIYPVAASLVDFVQQVSQVFHVRGGGLQILTVAIKFTPDFKPKNGPIFVDLFPQVSVTGDFSEQFPKMSFYQSPQDEDSATVTIGIVTPNLEVDYYIRVIATGVSRGKFTKV
jgi:hypothetical protein